MGFVEEMAVNLVESRVQCVPIARSVVAQRTPRTALEWVLLGTSLLKSFQAAVIVTGQRHTPVLCMIRALDLDKTCYDGWSELAKLLPPREALMIEGQEYSAKHCYATCAEIMPLRDNPFYELARILEPEETVVIGGAEWTRAECLARGLTLQPRYWAYMALGRALLTCRDASAVIRGRIWNSRSCFACAVALRRDLPRAYKLLASTLRENESITLLSGEWDRDRLLRHAEGLKPASALCES